MLQSCAFYQVDKATFQVPVIKIAPGPLEMIHQTFSVYVKEPVTCPKWRRLHKRLRYTHISNLY